LNNIINNSNIKIDKEAVSLISKRCNGSMRKALNILEDLSIGAKKEITVEQVTDVVGIFSRKTIFELITAAKKQDIRKANNIFYTLKIVNKVTVIEIIHEMVKYIDESINIPIESKIELFALLAEVEWRCCQGADEWTQLRWFLSKVKDVGKGDD